MKYAVPLLAAVLVAGGVCLKRGSSAAKTVPVLQSTAAEVLSAGRSPEEGTVSALRPSGVEPRDRAVGIRVVAVERKQDAGRPAPSVGWKTMSAQLERTLSLTPVQIPLIEEILQAREKEINALQEGIRKIGVLNIRDYEWQIGQMKGSWYRRIDALLDGTQHDLFIPLLEKGLFNEGLAFTVEPGMTVLE